MSLDILLDPLPERSKNRPCKVGKILSGLTDPWKTALLDLLARPYTDGGLSDEELAARMSQAGIGTSATVLNRHRRGRCTCESVVVG